MRIARNFNYEAGLCTRISCMRALPNIRTNHEATAVQRANIDGSYMEHATMRLFIL